MTIRALATGLFSFIVVTAAAALISANVRELARQRGWDTFLIRWWDALPENWKNSFTWQSLRGRWWLWSIFGLSGGMALALWLNPLIVGAPNTTAPRTDMGQTTQPHAQIATLSKQLPPASNVVFRVQATEAIDLNHYSRKTCFDYSTNNGVVSVSLNDTLFKIQFSKGNTTSIYVYKDSTNLKAVANLKNVKPGENVYFGDFDSSSRVYGVPLGGYFMVENDDGYYLLGRILSIKDDTRGDANDEVCFAYRIDMSKNGKFKAF